MILEIILILGLLCVCHDQEIFSLLVDLDIYFTINMFQISNDWSSILRRPPMGLSSPLYQPRVLFCEHCSNLTRKIWNPIQYFGRLDSLATSWLGPLWAGDTWKVYWGCATEHGAAGPGSTVALGPWLSIMTDIRLKTHDLLACVMGVMRYHGSWQNNPRTLTGK